MHVMDATADTITSAILQFKIRVVEAVSLLGFLLICLQVVEAEIRGVWEALWK